jgi:predicted nucleic acid-binding protein
LTQSSPAQLSTSFFPSHAKNDLTEYDAPYVELALREALPLATLDDKIGRAATHVGIAFVTT